MAKRQNILFIVIMMISASGLFAQTNIPAAVPKNNGYRSVKAGDMVLQWEAEGLFLNIKLYAPTKGWLAVGFDPESMMKGANVIIGYLTEQHVVIEDQYGDGRISHKSDILLGGTDDVTKKSGVFTNGGTELSFTIPLDSADNFDKKLMPGKVYKVIMAYGEETNMGKKHLKDYSVLITL